MLHRMTATRVTVMTVWPVVTAMQIQTVIWSVIHGALMTVLLTMTETIHEIIPVTTTETCAAAMRIAA